VYIADLFGIGTLRSELAKDVKIRLPTCGLLAMVTSILCVRMDGNNVMSVRLWHFRYLLYDLSASDNAQITLAVSSLSHSGQVMDFASQ